MGKGHREFAESMRNILREQEALQRRQGGRRRNPSEAELFDIQAELNAKFDELFGTSEDE